ncbi:tryptophan halogenase family protein [Pseudoalteromonas byunsanensis]|uniref:Tryptophan halogenase n=1 Tax=Pseudoalteromonas byunsanensis TaxID=327939 RepID=A0A1S1N858_9GAMM|nr:tryptophan halogenase family protein [Pseudoalteromonas byunsanensis]OHU94858.1 tryptophan halogenase [Pseudoalteromonas byunsanensis]
MNKSHYIENYVVVGGGTAGWISACLLASKLKDDPRKSVTLIEAPDIPIIGVGEGTVPSIRNTLKKIGISETELFRECDATFKQSIKFVNWNDKYRHRGKNFYHHLFDYPMPFGDDLSSYWKQQRNDELTSASFAQFVSIQYDVAESGLAPKDMTNAQYEGVCDYAYHIDAHKFAQLLKTHAIRNLNVQYIQDKVIDLKLDSSGHIQSLLLEQQGEKSYDFYVDCSGFSSFILGQKLQVPFKSQSDIILTDTALTIQVPAVDEAIPPYTISTAHQAGWIWDIALTQRRGVGLVYSSQFMDENAALEKLSRYTQMDLTDSSVRKIDMQIGYREKFWHKNCVAIGLSQGFVEPLEATAILLSDFSANLLCNKLPDSYQQLSLLASRYNQRVEYAWRGVVDFVKLHYCISDRNDSEFWRANRNPNSIPVSLQDKLALWQHCAISKDDFFSKFEVFDIENYLYVLNGMNFTGGSQFMSGQARHNYAEQVQRVKDTAAVYKQKLLSHRELINKIYQYGLPKV